MAYPLKLAVDVAFQAGKHIRSLIGKSQIRQKDSSFNLVTQADTESEKMILSAIQQVMPDSTFLSEETHWEQSVMADKLWIVDPIDGTNNFAHSIPHYSISIAYAENGNVKIAVVYDPVRDEMFTAEANKGAFLNGKSISVSSCRSLDRAVIGTGLYYDRGEMMDNTLFAIHRLLKANVQGIRRMGSAALDLSWVACGRYDGYFEYMLSPWDFAAGMLLVKEAGGIFSDRDGLDSGLISKGVICCTGEIREHFENLVKWNTVNDLSELRLR